MIYDIETWIAAAISSMSIFVAIAYLLLGADDILIDVRFWFEQVRKPFRRAYPRLTLEELRSARQQRIAIFVPCWHEADVIDRVLKHAVESIDYQNYEILVGVYPNDLETIEKVQAVHARFPRVRAVVNGTPGPTTKGQNLNSVFAEMRTFEGDEPFDIIVMHDAEDVIHPYELLVYNRLIPRKAMVQLPVFPLEVNVRKWTSWTYADEFVESHLKDLFVRELLGGFVPSAGVGCGFDRRALERLSTTAGEIFPSDSLTEDYVMGMRLGASGSSTVLVHQILLERDRPERFVRAGSYVATRAFFPDTMGAAVRQKRRWTTGICFQAWQKIGWSGGFATRYALYRDRKGIIGNPLILMGYALMLCGLGLDAWHAVDDQIALPSAGMSQAVWCLFDIVIVLTLSRLVQRCYFVALMYGPRQGVLSLLRVPWAGVINALATFGAAAAFFRSCMTGQTLKWSKTAHAFPTDEVLRGTL
ncbi:MAG: hypothetical protein NVSMB64_00590 [Candidatus Velthaea sp.]